MRFALYSRKVDEINLKKIKLLVNKLNTTKKIEFCYNALIFEMANKFNINLPQGDVFKTHNDLPDNIDIFLSLGGDGTFLESLTYVRDKRIPIAGINFGRLGFLTTAKFEEENDWLEALVNGDYKTEERSLLFLEANGVPKQIYPYALNEITVQRSTPAILEINVSIDGNSLPTYWADGLVIATSTGSTAYSMSIGGPIVTPDSKVIILAPIAPHNLNIRPLVIPDTSVIEITYKGRDERALVSLDNRYYKFNQGDTIKIFKGENTLCRVSMDNNYIGALNEKLLWGEDKRNK